MHFVIMVNLWGVLILKGVLTNYFLTNCLKLLLHMLLKQSNTKEFKFAIMVLDRCKNRQFKFYYKSNLIMEFINRCFK